MWRDKSIGEGFKDVDTKKGIVCGYFSKFGNKDSDGDIIVAGAYAQTIAENGPKSSRPRIKHLLDHDTTKAVGKLLELKEDSVGLYYESQAGKHSVGQDFLLMVEDGIITEHSVRFITQKWERDDTDDAYRLLQVKLKEGSSLQCWGANEDTPIVAVKSLDPKELNQRFEVLKNAFKNGKYTDDSFMMLEKHIKEIEEILKGIEVEKPLEEGKKGELTFDLFSKALN